MCGRYTLRRAALVAAAMQAMVDMPALDDFYLGPSDDVPVVRQRDSQRIVDLASWGFVPSWARGKPKTKPINAKSETVQTNGMFRNAFKSSRCLFPADGFFEPKGPKGMKHRPQFYFHRADDGIFAMAGVWSHSELGPTCALLTTTPNGIVGQIHDRMPVILHPDDYGKWLDPRTAPDELLQLLRPAPDADLIFEAVHPKANGEPSLFE
jgi:putative SOS response-associated peptidase YedK